MAQYQIFKPNHPLLKSSIEDYMYVSGELPFSSKKIPPRPGASLIIDFESPFYCDDTWFLTALIGSQEASFIYRPGSVHNDHLVIRFQPHGLSRFTDTPVHELTNQIVDPEAVLGHGLHNLYKQAGSLSLERRIALVERFLLARYSLPSTADESIFRIAKVLREDFESVDFDLIREQTPLSARQIERKFKASIGVNMQTYIRLCRFDYAKSLTSKQPSASLTEISFNAGYYDQPHFSNEVKRMTGVSPKHLSTCMAT